MKATIDIPDELYRRVKARSAEDGVRIREVAIGLFRRWLDGEVQVVGPETSGPVPLVGRDDLRRYPNVDSVRKAFPRGYRLTGSLLPSSRAAAPLRATAVDDSLATMDQDELNAHARPG